MVLVSGFPGGLELGLAVCGDGRDELGGQQEAQGDGDQGGLS